MPLVVGALIAGAAAAHGVSAPDAAAGAGWQALPPAPIDLASVQTGVWTGREALFTMPGKDTRPAAAFNPATRSWRALPGPGLVTLAEGHDHSVWTGRDWLVWGPGPTLAYRPATGRWRRLPPSPVVQTRAVVVWTGSQMIGWGGGCCGDFLADGASYRPATNAWRKLPTSPLEGRQTAAGAWTGREMVIVGGFREEEVGGVVQSVDLADAAAYNPATRRWRRLPSLPTGRRDATAVWDGRDVLVVGGFVSSSRPPYRRLLSGVFAYRPSTNRWRRLSPLPHGRDGHAAVWTGARMLVWGGEVKRDGKLVTPRTGLSYDPATDRWSPIPAATVPGRLGPTALWTGRSMIVASGGQPVPGAAVYTPAVSDPPVITPPVAG